MYPLPISKMKWSSFSDSFCLFRCCLGNHVHLSDSIQVLVNQLQVRNIILMLIHHVFLFKCCITEELNIIEVHRAIKKGITMLFAEIMQKKMIRILGKKQAHYEMLTSIMWFEGFLGCMHVCRNNVQKQCW